MAQQRVDSRVVVQPSGGFATTNFALDSALAAQGWRETAAGFQTLHDIVQKDYDEEAVRQAQTDAPALIKKDGSGAVLPVASFEAPGITSKAYRDAYRSAAFNYYSANVEQQHSGFLNEVLTKYPTDPVAAKAAIDQKRAATVAGLDPQFAPLVTLRLNAMGGQALSRINANVQAEQNAVAEKNAKWAYDTLILDAGKLAQVPDRFDRDFIATNHNMLVAQLDRYIATAKQAGYGDARIAQELKDARIKTIIARDEQMIRSSKITAQNYTAEGYNEWLTQTRDAIEQRRKELGADGPAYINAMAPALAWAQTSNQLQVEKYDQGKRNEDFTKAIGFLDAARNKRDGTPGAEEAYAAAVAERNRVYTDSSLSPSQKVRRLSAMDGALGSLQSDITDYATRTVTSMVSEMMDDRTPAPRSKALRQEIRQFIDDPSNTYMPVGVRNYAERTLSSLSASEAKTDFAAFQTNALTGRVMPEHVQQRGRDMLAKGQIGDAPNALIRPDAWAALQNQAEDAYKQRQMVTATSKQVTANAAQGIAPSASQQQQVAQDPAMQFTNGGAPYDPAQPESRLNAAGHLQRTMTVPPQVKSFFAGLNMSGADPGQAAAGYEQYQQLKKVLMSKPTYQGPGGEERAIGFLRSELGEKAVDYIAIAKRFDAERASNYLFKSESDSRDLGTNENSAMDKLNASFDRMVQTMTQGHVSVPQRLNPFSDLDATQLWTRRMLGDKAPTLGRELVNDLSPTRQATNPGQIQQITVADDLRKEITLNAMGIMKRGGARIDVAHPDVKDPNDLAMMQAAEELRSQTELYQDPKDPTKATLQYKSGNKRLAEMVGLDRLSDQQVAGFGLAIWEEQMAYEKELGIRRLVPEIDRSKVVMVPWRSSDGALGWKIRAEEKGALGSVDLMTLRDDDPRISAAAGAIARQAAVNLRSEWYGKGPAPAEKDSSWWVGRVVGHMMTGLDTAGRNLFEPMKRQQFTGDLLDYLGRPDPDTRGYTRRVLDKVFDRPGDPSTWPGKTIDFSALREAIAKEHNEGLFQWAKDLDLMGRTRH